MNGKFFKAYLRTYQLKLNCMSDFFYIFDDIDILALLFRSFWK